MSHNGQSNAIRPFFADSVANKQWTFYKLQEKKLDSHFAVMPTPCAA